MAGRLGTEGETATQAQEGYSLVLAAELKFPSRTVRYHTGAGNLEWIPGQTYQGIGDLGRISKASETEALADSRVEMQITGLDVSASYSVSKDGNLFWIIGGDDLLFWGVDQDARLFWTKGGNIQTVFTEDVRGRRATLYLVMIDVDGIVVSSTIVYRGRIDNFTVRQGKTLTIGVNVENVLADWDREREIRFTNEQQQDRFPGDFGFEFVAQMAEKELPWGRQ